MEADQYADDHAARSVVWFDGLQFTPTRTVDAMSPSSEASGRRASVDIYEIVNDIELT
jgi:hypothetical protein